MSGRATIVLAPPAEPGLAERLARRRGVEVLVPSTLDDEESLRRADLLVTRTVHRVDRALLERAPRLAAVVQASAGLDNVDAAAVEARGVRLVQVDPGNASAVAELTLMSLVALARGARELWSQLAAGHWPDRDRVRGRQLEGARLGIVGLGRVGSRVARLARTAGMEVLAVDPYIPDRAFERHGAQRAATLEAMLPHVPFLTLHCPLTEATRGLLDGPRLDLLPHGAFLVNTARGGIVDEEALLARLDSGRIAGAALDVFRTEPAPDRRLVRHPAVLPTPHVAGHTEESRARRLEHLLAALDSLLTERARGAGP